MITEFKVTKREAELGIIKSWDDDEERISYYLYNDGHIEKTPFGNDVDNYNEDKWDYFFKDNPVI